MTISLNFWFSPKDNSPDTDSTTPVQDTRDEDVTLNEADLLNLMRHVEEVLGDNLKDPKPLPKESLVD